MAIQKKNLPLVSIITPSYNQGQYLEDTIKSVIDQSYPNVQYILIDGGSTDNSIDVIKKYEPYFDYWVSEKDGGQSEAINKGYAKAKGELVAWLNSDDMYENHKVIETVVNAWLQNKETSMVYGKCITIDESGKPFPHIYGQETTFDNLLKKGLPSLTAQPACFFVSKFLKERGYFLNNDLHYTMDADLIFYLIKKARPVFVDNPFAVARFHANCKSVKDRNKMSAESFKTRRKHSTRFSQKIHFTQMLLRQYVFRMLSENLQIKILKRKGHLFFYD